MKKIFFLIFLGTFFSKVIAQNGKLYQGTINKTTKITLYLEGLDVGTFADQITGSYQYEGKRDFLLLNGFRNNSGNINLVEFSSVNFSGTFSGALIANKITGNWISADQKRNYKFELIQIVPAKNQLQIYHNAMIDKRNEFANY